MHSFLRAAALTVAALIAITPAASAHEYSAGTITVVHPWAAATPPGAKTGAAYMQIVNKGKKPVNIVKLSTAVADKVELHFMTMKKGVMRMRPLKMPLRIKANTTLELNHDGFHLMLIGLKKPLAEEEMVPFKLELEGGKTISVDLYIEAIGATASTHGH